MSEELKARLISFGFRLLLAAVVAIIATATKILPELGLNTTITAVVILILNEVSGFINKEYQVGNRVVGGLKGIAGMK